MLGIMDRRAIVGVSPIGQPDPRDGWKLYALGAATILNSQAGDSITSDTDGWITAALANNGDRREPYNAVEVRWPDAIDLTPGSAAPPSFTTCVEMYLEVESLGNHAWLGIGIRDPASSDIPHPNGYARMLLSRRDESGGPTTHLQHWGTVIWDRDDTAFSIRNTAVTVPYTLYGRADPNLRDVGRIYGEVDLGALMGARACGSDLTGVSEGAMHPLVWFGSYNLASTMKVRPWFRISRFGLPA